MSSGMESSAPRLDARRERRANTSGPLRGILGCLAGLMLALLALVALTWLGTRVPPSAGMAVAGFAALLPGGGAQWIQARSWRNQQVGGDADMPA